MILAVAMMAVGEQSSLLTRTAKYMVRFPNAEGLHVGSPVKMAGVEVGAVTGIRAADRSGGPGYRGIPRCAARLCEQVAAGFVGGPAHLQLLSGEKFVEITAGNPELAVLDRGPRFR